MLASKKQILGILLMILCGVSLNSSDELLSNSQKRFQLTKSAVPFNRNQLPIAGIDHHVAKSTTAPDNRCDSSGCIGQVKVDTEIRFSRGTVKSFSYVPQNSSHLEPGYGKIYIPDMTTRVFLEYQYTHPVSDFCHLFTVDSEGTDEWTSATSQGKQNLMKFCTTSAQQKNGTGLSNDINFTFRSKEWQEYALESKYPCGHWTADAATMRVAQMPVPTEQQGMAVFRIAEETTLHGQLCVEFDQTVCVEVSGSSDQGISVDVSDYMTVSINNLRAPKRFESGFIVAWYSMNGLGKPIITETAFISEAGFGAGLVKGAVGEFQTNKYPTRFDMANGLRSYDFYSELSTTIIAAGSQSTQSFRVQNTIQSLNGMKVNTLNDLALKSGRLGIWFKNGYIMKPAWNMTYGDLIPELTIQWSATNSDNVIIQPLIGGWLIGLIVAAIVAAVVIGTVGGVAGGAASKTCTVPREQFEPITRARTIFTNLESAPRRWSSYGYSYPDKLPTVELTGVGMSTYANFSDYEDQRATLTVTASNLKFEYADVGGKVSVVNIPACTLVRYGSGSFCDVRVVYEGMSNEVSYTSNVIMLKTSVNLNPGENTMQLAFRSPGTESITPNMCFFNSDGTKTCGQADSTDYIDRSASQDPGFTSGESNPDSTPSGSFSDILALDAGLTAMWVLLIIFGCIGIIVLLATAPKWIKALMSASAAPSVAEAFAPPDSSQIDALIQFEKESTLSLERIEGQLVAVLTLLAMLVICKMVSILVKHFTCKGQRADLKRDEREKEKHQEEVARAISTLSSLKIDDDVPLRRTDGPGSFGRAKVGNRQAINSSFVILLVLFLTFNTVTSDADLCTYGGMDADDGTDEFVVLSISSSKPLQAVVVSGDINCIWSKKKEDTCGFGDITLSAINQCFCIPSKQTYKIKVKLNANDPDDCEFRNFPFRVLFDCQKKCDHLISGDANVESEDVVVEAVISKITQMAGNATNRTGNYYIDNPEAVEKVKSESLFATLQRLTRTIVHQPLSTSIPKALKTRIDLLSKGQVNAFSDVLRPSPFATTRQSWFMYSLITKRYDMGGDMAYGSHNGYCCAAPCGETQIGSCVNEVASMFLGSTTGVKMVSKASSNKFASNVFQGGPLYIKRMISYSSVGPNHGAIDFMTRSPTYGHAGYCFSDYCDAGCHLNGTDEILETATGYLEGNFSFTPGVTAIFMHVRMTTGICKSIMGFTFTSEANNWEPPRFGAGMDATLLPVDQEMALSLEMNLHAGCTVKTWEGAHSWNGFFFPNAWSESTCPDGTNRLFAVAIPVMDIGDISESMTLITAMTPCHENGVPEVFVQLSSITPGMLDASAMNDFEQDIIEMLSTSVVKSGGTDIKVHNDDLYQVQGASALTYATIRCTDTCIFKYISESISCQVSAKAQTTGAGSVPLLSDLNSCNNPVGIIRLQGSTRYIRLGRGSIKVMGYVMNKTLTGTGSTRYDYTAQGDNFYIYGSVCTAEFFNTVVSQAETQVLGTIVPTFGTRVIINLDVLEDSTYSCTGQPAQTGLNVALDSSCAVIQMKSRPGTLTLLKAGDPVLPPSDSKSGDVMQMHTSLDTPEEYTVETYEGNCSGFSGAFNCMWENQPWAIVLMILLPLIAIAVALAICCSWIGLKKIRPWRIRRKLHKIYCKMGKGEDIDARDEKFLAKVTNKQLKMDILSQVAGKEKWSTELIDAIVSRESLVGMKASEKVESEKWSAKLKKWVSKGWEKIKSKFPGKEDVQKLDDETMEIASKGPAKAEKVTLSSKDIIDKIKKGPTKIN